MKTHLGKLKFKKFQGHIPFPWTPSLGLWTGPKLRTKGASLLFLSPPKQNPLHVLASYFNFYLDFSSSYQSSDQDILSN